MTPRREGVRLEDTAGQKGMEDVEGIKALREVDMVEGEVDDQVEDDVRARRGRLRPREPSRSTSGSSTLRCGM
jgi:hypothetical protein